MTRGAREALAVRARESLLEALESVGVKVRWHAEPGDTNWARPDARLRVALDDHTSSVGVVIKSQVTADSARALAARPGFAECDARLVVADRIGEEARAQLTGAGWSWLDLRGHLRLRAAGVLIDTEVASSRAAETRGGPAIRGRGGMAVAYWLCAHREQSLSPTKGSARLGVAPSTVSTALSQMAVAGLVTRDRRAVLPELFWELAASWKPSWQWLASEPDPQDWPDPERGTSWVRTGDAAAIDYGAPLVSGGRTAAQLFVPGPVDLTIAARRYGTATAGAGAAAIAVAPVHQVFDTATAAVPPGAWADAPELAVALHLAGDGARGRQILEEWSGDGGHVWH